MNCISRICVSAVLVLGMWANCTMAVSFYENFDSYTAGSNMNGNGNWKPWDSNPAWDATVSNAQSISPGNSVLIDGADDLVHEFTVTGGQHIFTASQYIPSEGSGSSYFILLNTYNDGGPYDWSVQINFDQDTGQLISDKGNAQSLPIIYDAWVALQFVIDLDANTVSEFYNGALLSTHIWDDDLNNTLGAVDLFSDGATSVYYDNIGLSTVPGPASWALLGMGLGVVFVRRRRKKSATE